MIETGYDKIRLTMSGQIRLRDITVLGVGVEGNLVQDVIPEISGNTYEYRVIANAPLQGVYMSFDTGFSPNTVTLKGYNIEAKTWDTFAVPNISLNAMDDRDFVFIIIR